MEGEQRQRGGFAGHGERGEEHRGDKDDVKDGVGPSHGVPFLSDLAKPPSRRDGSPPRRAFGPCGVSVAPRALSEAVRLCVRRLCTRGAALPLVAARGLR